MNNEPETLTIRVIETVEHQAEVELTDDLLDEAEGEGYARTALGVLEMLQGHPDHDEVLDIVASPENFMATLDREVFMA